MTPSLDGTWPPPLDALVAGQRGAAWLTAEGEFLQLSHGEAAGRLRPHAGAPPLPLVCHMPATARRLGIQPFAALDLLELFAFVHPARFALPTPRGLAEALGLEPAPVPHARHQPDPAADAIRLARCAASLLAALTPAGLDLLPAERKALPGIAAAMARAGWAWGKLVLDALGEVAAEGSTQKAMRQGLAAWERLPEWVDEGPPPPPTEEPVLAEEARQRLAHLLGRDAEDRQAQADYASGVAAAFAPRPEAGAPRVVLAEAGTGVGKTMGYMAAAQLWATRNRGTVWISTFTRNLQQQIDRELDRIYPDPEEKARAVVIRKGRENYLCLLNLEEAVQGALGRLAGVVDPDAIALALMARWTAASRDGALTGGDFPGWLAELIGRARSAGLADRRGECIFAACGHYRRCFVERAVRRGRKAEVVVANHALVMVLAATGGAEDGTLPGRYVFDEGHHLFDAADGAFSGLLSGQAMVELRRWLLGAESGRAGGSRSRARGLKRRIEELVADDPALLEQLDEALRAARCLPDDGWLARLRDIGGREFDAGEFDGRGEGGALLPATRAGGTEHPAEAFLAALSRQTYARARDPESGYGLECDCRPLGEGVETAARGLDRALATLQAPLQALAKGLTAKLDDAAETLDPGQRARIDGAVRGLSRRTDIELAGWRAMLRALLIEADERMVDWMAIERIDGRDIDIGLHAHWIDPMRPFAEAVAKPAHGFVVTSATLTDGSGDAERDWATAEARTGAVHLPRPALRLKVSSPFAYPELTRVLIVGDVRKDDLGQVAAAYRTLFLAANGGALGLFTAVQRLRGVHGRIAGPLEAAGLQLLAQHVDGMDAATLVDIFRAEEDACLLGTDALRDGVDVPGRSLRLIVFDRVPWPRPDILHRARRLAHPIEAGGAKGYDDMIVRLRLKQAFGRLVRRADDRGVFVLLDPMMPSRLLGAFPPGVETRRCGLAEAAEVVRAWVG